MAEYLAPYLDKIKRFEGWSPKSFWDYKQHSIGYGTRAKYPGEVIDKAEGERRLAAELAKADSLVSGFAPNLPTGARAALTSLTYNAGSGWMNAGLGQAVKSGDVDAIRNKLLQYNKAGGSVLPGLAKRRAEEASWLDGTTIAPANNTQPPVSPEGLDQPQNGAPAPATPGTAMAPRTANTTVEAPMPELYSGPSAAQLALAQKMALAQIGQATDTSPVGHWTAALARALGGLGGGMRMAQAADAEKAMQDNQRALLAKMMGGGAPEAMVPGMLANPLMADTGKAIALAQYKQRLQAQQPEGWGKAGAVFQDPADGRFKAIQFGERGNIKTHDLGGMAPAKGVEKVGGDLINKATGETVRNIEPQLAAGEKAKKEGQLAGEMITKVPGAQMTLETLKAKDQLAFDTIDRTLGELSGYNTGMAGAIASKIPGTQAHNIANRLNTLKAQSGFAELQAMRDASPTGGALGQVSEMENRLLQSVWGAIEQSQTEDELRRNLQNLKVHLRGREQRMMRNLERLQVIQGKTATPMGQAEPTMENLRMPQPVAPAQGFGGLPPGVSIRKID